MKYNYTLLIILAILGSWGPVNSNTAAYDFDGNGFVNTGDILVALQDHEPPQD